MIVEAVSCFLCSATLFWVVWSEAYLYFVTPKMKYYIYFAAAVFFFWGIYELFITKRQSYKHRFNSYYLLFVMSACLIISCIYRGSRSKDSYEDVETLIVGKARSESVLKQGLNEDKKEIVVTSENFLAWINELRVDPHRYNGYTVTMEGSMGLKKEEGKSNEFYLIRWYMSCCAADVVPVGILCEQVGSNTIEKEAYVRVQGTIRCMHTEKGENAEILVKSIEQIAEPKEKYIY